MTKPTVVFLEYLHNISMDLNGDSLREAIIANLDALTRLVGSVLIEINNEWQVGAGDALLPYKGLEHLY